MFMTVVINTTDTTYVNINNKHNDRLPAAAQLPILTCMTTATGANATPEAEFFVLAPAACPNLRYYRYYRGLNKYLYYFGGYTMGPATIEKGLCMQCSRPPPHTELGGMGIGGVLKYLMIGKGLRSVLYHN